jgi:hypothetical protein
MMRCALAELRMRRTRAWSKRITQLGLSAQGLFNALLIALAAYRGQKHQNTCTRGVRWMGSKYASAPLAPDTTNCLSTSPPLLLPNGDMSGGPPG